MGNGRKLIVFILEVTDLKSPLDEDALRETLPKYRFVDLIYVVQPSQRGMAVDKAPLSRGKYHARTVIYKSRNSEMSHLCNRSLPSSLRALLLEILKKIRKSFGDPSLLCLNYKIPRKRRKHLNPWLKILRNDRDS